MRAAPFALLKNTGCRDVRTFLILRCRHTTAGPVDMPAHIRRAHPAPTRGSSGLQTLGTGDLAGPVSVLSVSRILKGQPRTILGPLDRGPRRPLVCPKSRTTASD